MNIAMKLTFDSLVRALRWKALAVGEEVIVKRNRDADDAGGGKHENWRDSITESPV